MFQISVTLIGSLLIPRDRSQLLRYFITFLTVQLMLITLACPQHFTGTRQDVYCNKRQKLGTRHVSWVIPLYPDVLRVWGVIWHACPQRLLLIFLWLSTFHDPLASAELFSHSSVSRRTWTAPKILIPGHGVYWACLDCPSCKRSFPWLLGITTMAKLATARVRIAFILFTDPRSSSWRVLALLLQCHHSVPLIIFITFFHTCSDSPGSSLSIGWVNSLCSRCVSCLGL